MKAKKILSALTALTLLPTVGAFTAATPAAAAENDTVKVQLDPSDASPFNNGEFEGWGTSLCWWANRLGYSDTLTQAAADAFFSDDGLSLDIARYNIGGGDDPSHDHVTRSDSKVPGVWETWEYTNDGADVDITSYDMTNDQNQLNIAKAALAANPDIYFEGFSNSPPYFMTNSGCSSGAADAATDNLRSDMYDDFAEYIAESTQLLKENGIEFKSYSPMNEPDTNYWGANSPKQEGCHYDPGTSQSNMIVETRKALDEAGLNDVLVAGMDETSIDTSVTNLDKLTEDAKEDLGRIDTHTYGGSRRTQLKAKAIEMGKDLWMSEVDGGWDGFGLADRIITDMNGMQPTAWVMWDIVDVHKDSDFRDPSGNATEANNSVSYTGSLWGVGMADHDNEELVLTNKYYMFGQFTKYIEPGDTIIASSDSTLAAYNKDTGDIKIVVSNSTGNDIDYSFDLGAFSAVGTDVSEIRSDREGAEKWAAITGEATLTDKVLTTTAKAGTVTTYIISGVNDAALISFTADANGLSYSYKISYGLEYKDAYFAVYDNNGALRYVSTNTDSGTAEGDFTGCTPKLLIWNDNQEPAVDSITSVSDENVHYGVITGGSDDLELNSTVDLTLESDLEGTVTWSVSDENIASITADGKLTTKALGSVTVYAEIAGCTFSRTFNIPFSGTINGVGSTLRVDASAQLSLAANITGDVSWSVSDEDVALITPDGLLTGLAPGEVTIYASIDGHTIEKTIRVQLYTITGTPSWSDGSSEPKDSDDYTQVADGNFETYFDGVSGGWVMYDYGAPYMPSEILLAARSGNNMDARTIGGTVQGSNDGITWTDLYKITSAIPAGQYTKITSDMLSNNYAYRYFRYTNNENMTNIAEFIVNGTFSENVAEGEPSITDLNAMSDDFEGSSNIFGASQGDLSSNGSQVYASGLGRFSNVFAPVKTTSTASLSEPVTLTENQRFRFTFNMFAGWEDNGRDNTLSIKDAEGNDVFSMTVNVGNCNFKALSIGGQDVLNGATVVAQCRTALSGRTGANGWDSESQPYRNNVGYNKTIELLIDGAGNASLTISGGTSETQTFTATLDEPVNIASLTITGDHRSSAKRTVCYDNFDADIITYSSGFEPEETPEPTTAPVLPESGELISLDFNNGDLASGSTYGKASGTPAFGTENENTYAQFDGTRSTAVNLTDANGNSLLTGQDNITIAFKVKPTSSATSWWFFAAPNANEQTYQHEQYIGVFTSSGTMTVERYSNSGARSESLTGAYLENEWNDVMISFDDTSTTLYINGTAADTADSTVNISDMLGSSSVAYIGLANWKTGEYAKGGIDDFVIYNRAVENPLGSIELGDTSEVIANITIPAIKNVTWSTSDPSVVTDAGVITRADDTKTAVLTAKTTENGVEFTRDFNITVIGYKDSLGSFTAYAENGTIYYEFYDYAQGVTPTTSVTITKQDDEGVSRVDQQDGNLSGSFTALSNGTYKLTGTAQTMADDRTVSVSTTKTVIVKAEPETTAYLFAHFADNESESADEQIYFSVSKDGQTWTTLNNGAPVLTSNVGETGVRDPYILRGEDGKYFIIATDLSIYSRKQTQGSNAWGLSQMAGSKSIVVWESNDLVNWSEANLVKVAVDNAGCTWAPEAIYDPEKGRYMVFWASKTSDDNYSKQCIYRSYTEDFKTFTEPELYIEDDVSNIDTTMIEYKGIYYRFTKNESKSSIIMEKSNFLDGKWTPVDTYNLGDMTGYEGPAIYKLNGEDSWCLLLDYYSKSQGYKPFTTNDLAEGVFTQAADFTFDGTYRHGTVMPITESEYNALREEYGA